MYSFKRVDINEINGFAENNGIYSQTFAWAEFRSIFKPVCFKGEDNSGNMVLSCILYLLPVYLTPYKIGYITRGFVCDYNNYDLVNEFCDFIKNYAKKHFIVYTIFDPWVDFKIDFDEDNENKKLIEIFEKNGFHRNSGHFMQPNTNYRLKIDANNDIDAEKKRLWNGFTQKLRNDIQLSVDRGVECERFNGENLSQGVKVFYDLLVETTKKKGFGHRSEKYYQRFAKKLSKYVTIYLWKYNSEIDINYTKNIINDVTALLKKINDEIINPETTNKKRERLGPKKRECEKQLDATYKRLEIAEKYTHNPYISASFYIKTGNKAYNLYGANSSALRELRLTANYWDMIQDSLDNTVSTFNMGGTLKLDTNKLKDDAMYDLYLYKSLYNGEFVELPGEFILISRSKLFNLLHTKLNYFKRIVFKF